MPFRPTEPTLHNGHPIRTANDTLIGAITSTGGVGSTWEPHILNRAGDGYQPIGLGGASITEADAMVRRHHDMLTRQSARTAPEQQPIKSLGAHLLDPVIESTWGHGPGYINEADIDVADKLIDRGLAEVIPNGFVHEGLVRITRLGWETARHHSALKTRLHRTKGYRIDDEPLPASAIPAYLNQ